MSGPSRHPIVQAWLDGKTDAGGCIADLEAALRKLDSARVGPRHDAVNILRGLIATKYGEERLRILDRGIGTALAEGVLWLAAREAVRDNLASPSEGPRRGLLELLREARASILSQRYHDTNPLIARIDAALAGTPAEVAPDAKDAARWRAFCSRVYAQKKVSDGGVVAFRFPSFVGGPELLKGSVAQHFTAAVDERWLSRPNPNSACASPVSRQEPTT